MVLVDAYSGNSCLVTDDRSGRTGGPAFEAGDTIVLKCIQLENYHILVFGGDEEEHTAAAIEYFRVLCFGSVPSSAVTEAYESAVEVAREESFKRQTFYAHCKNGEWQKLNVQNEVVVAGRASSGLVGKHVVNMPAAYMRGDVPAVTFVDGEVILVAAATATVRALDGETYDVETSVAEAYVRRPKPRWWTSA